MWLYLLLSAFSEPLWRLGLARRVRRGKEDPARAGEKLGHPGAARPEGELLWFHALSVGESLALVALLRRLGEALPEAHFLLTTTTRSSARALASAGLPPRVVHQYAPVDAPRPVRRFLDHWRPDLAAHAELDLWPRLLRATRARGVPVLLINSRMSRAQARSRARYRWLFRRVLSLFDAILLQDEASLPRFLGLGADPARTKVVGTLKAAGDPLPDRPEEREALAAAIGARPLWLAAATHEREEERIFEAHEMARRDTPGLLLIIAPRNPSEADRTAERAQRRFGKVARRSLGETPGPETEVYIADTFGEMGLWYRMCPVSFVGHSLSGGGEPLPGKNPFEAALLGSVILHGASVTNFEDNYAALQAAGAAVETDDPAGIAAALSAACDPDWRRPRVEAARRVTRRGGAALEETLGAILSHCGHGGNSAAGEARGQLATRHSR